ncbi:MAG: tetratricopeptide repeat protein, partial [Sterolibacterium sp.]|nr:tetratricopeptide repeat protein [Sterolibacterium sp.]
MASRKPVSAEKTLLTAVSHHRAGRLEQAKKLYQDILSGQPHHADANHNLGVIKMQQHQAAAALPYLLKALESQPGNGHYWLDYIEALHLSGETGVARQTFLDACTKGLSGPEATALATRLGMTSHHTAAPSSAEIDTLLRTFNEGQIDAATSHARKLTHQYPDHAFGWQVLAAALQHAGHHAEALPAAQRAAALAPDSATAQYNLGVIHSQLGHPTEAETHFLKSLSLQ